MLITSAQNPKIKFIKRLLDKAAFRKEEGLTVVEGLRELTLAIKAGFQVDSVFHCPEVKIQSANTEIQALKLPSDRLFTITKPVFDAVAYRENSDGVIALLKTPQKTLTDIALSENPFLILIEGIEKPGNLGAILRTADAAKVDAVIVCDPRTDLYNPNVIRSSVGCLFTVQVASCTNEDAFLWLNNNNIKPYAAALTAKKLYQDINFKLPSAIVMGTEADGLTDFWLTQAEQIKIPMRGEIDSLNVSASAAVLAFEAMRQRGF